MNQIMEASKAYNLGADQYDNRKWIKLWKYIEEPRIDDWIKSVNGKSLLDLGCGTCIYYENIKKRNNTYYGLDISNEMLSMAKTKYPEISNHLFLGSVDSLPFNENYFDRILCNRVLSHVPNIDDVFSEISRVLKYNGQVFITDIHPLHQYDNTGILTKNGMVYAQSYKHKLKDLFYAANKNHLKIKYFLEIETSKIPNEVLIDIDLNNSLYLLYVMILTTINE